MAARQFATDFVTACRSDVSALHKRIYSLKEV